MKIDEDMKRGAAFVAWQLEQDVNDMDVPEIETAIVLLSLLKRVAKESVRADCEEALRVLAAAKATLETGGEG